MEDLLYQTEEYIKSLLTTRLPEGMDYHNLEHTVQMVAAVSEIAAESLINEWEKHILLVAAWFHDSGYCFGYQGHEAISMTLAGDFLRQAGQREQFINAVYDCIRATQMPQAPKSALQAIMCDADMRHLSLPDYDQHAARLRSEWGHRLGKQMNDHDWLSLNLQFFTNHSYFTGYARDHWEVQKAKNQQLLQTRLAEGAANSSPEI